MTALAVSIAAHAVLALTFPWRRAGEAVPLAPRPLAVAIVERGGVAASTSAGAAAAPVRGAAAAVPRPGDPSLAPEQVRGPEPVPARGLRRVEPRRSASPPRTSAGAPAARRALPHARASGTAPGLATAAEAPRRRAVEERGDRARGLSSRGRRPASGATAGAGAVDLRAWCRNCPRPDYPARARRHGWHGTVDVALRVGRDGAVEQARVERSSGYAVLDSAAVRVARRSRFELATGAERLHGRLRYHFVLEDTPSGRPL